MKKTKNAGKNGGFVGIVVLIVALVVIGGGAAYVSSRQAAKVETEATADTSGENTLVTSGMETGTTMSMKDLLALGKNVKCTFNQSAAGAESSGVIYVAGGKMRGDFTAQTPAGTIDSHMIADGQFMDVWTDMMNQGFKMQMNAQVQAGAQANPGVPDVNQKLDYQCDDWRPDSAVFTPPTEVVFAEINADAPVPAGLPGGVNIPGGVNVPGGLNIPGGVSLPGGY